MGKLFGKNWGSFEMKEPISTKKKKHFAENALIYTNQAYLSTVKSGELPFIGITLSWGNSWLPLTNLRKFANILTKGIRSS